MTSPKTQPITVRNHYVAQLYLKRWTGDDSMLSRYSLLVPQKNVAPWKRSSTAAIGYHQHLYTRMAGGKETDEVEKWLNYQFETPAEIPFSKAVSEQHLTQQDWRVILRFMLMQDVRTPASFVRFRTNHIQTLPDLMQDVMEGSVRQLMEAKLSGEVLEPRASAATADFPSVITRHIEPGADFGMLKAEIPVGRSLWLWSLRQPYSRTLEAIYRLKTTIVKPPRGMDWVTSDDPVLRVNYYSHDNYDFKGGYGHPRTEILFPLGPQHLLYAKVDSRPAFEKYQRVPEATAVIFQKLLMQKAHRNLFAVAPDPMVEKFHPRHVSLEGYNHEVAQWQTWHQEQSAAETASAKP